MKIGFLTERMLLGFGVDLVVHEQARHLHRLGHDVRVFTAKADQGMERSYDLHVLSEVVPGFYDYTSRSAIRSFLKSRLASDVDIWILHTPPFYAWVADIEAPVIFVEHGSPPGHLFDNGTAYHLWRLMHAHHAEDYGRLRSGDAILSISKYIENTLPEDARAYSTVLHHGADHYRRAHLGERLRFRFEHGVGHDDVLILWVGRMQFDLDEQPYKGFQSLLEMLPSIKRLGENVKIALLGKVTEEDTARLGRMGVIVLPNFPAALMGTAYAAADVLLNLSQWEGFNLALVESQFQGTPCVAYNVGPHAEVTAPGRSALLVSSAGEVLPALKSLVNDAALRTEMRKHALEFVKAFRWEENARSLESLLVQSMHRARAVRQRPRSELGLLRVPVPSKCSQSGQASVVVIDWAPV